MIAKARHAPLVIYSICEKDTSTDDSQWPLRSLDFGRITSDDNTVVLYLFGVPNARRFDFIWDVVASGCLACITMIDSCHPETFREALSMLQVFRAYSPLPIVIAANFQDLPDAWDVEALRIALGIANDVPIIPCVATDRESVKAVLLALLNEVLKDSETVAQE